MNVQLNNVHTIKTNIIEKIDIIKRVIVQLKDVLYTKIYKRENVQLKVVHFIKMFKEGNVLLKDVHCIKKLWEIIEIDIINMVLIIDTILEVDQEVIMEDITIEDITIEIIYLY